MINSNDLYEATVDAILKVELGVANAIDNGMDLTPARVAATIVCFMMKEVGAVLEDTLDKSDDYRYDLAQAYKQQADILQNIKGE